MNRNYEPKAPALRAAFAAAALVATLGIGSFIDTLATGYGEAAQQAQAPAVIQLARR